MVDSQRRIRHRFEPYDAEHLFGPDGQLGVYVVPPVADVGEKLGLRQVGGELPQGLVGLSAFRDVSADPQSARRVPWSSYWVVTRNSTGILFAVLVDQVRLIGGRVPRRAYLS